MDTSWSFVGVMVLTTFFSVLIMGALLLVERARRRRAARLYEGELLDDADPSETILWSRELDGLRLRRGRYTEQIQPANKNQSPFIVYEFIELVGDDPNANCMLSSVRHPHLRRVAAMLAPSEVQSWGQTLRWHAPEGTHVDEERIVRELRDLWRCLTGPPDEVWDELVSKAKAPGSVADPYRVMVLRYAPNTEEAVDVARRGLTSNDPEVLARSAIVLGDQHALGQAVLGKYTPAELRRRAFQRFREVGDEAAVTALIDKGLVSDGDVLVEMLELVPDCPDPSRLEPRLIALLEYDGFVPFAAANVLGRVGGPDAVRPLKALLRSVSSLERRHLDVKLALEELRGRLSAHGGEGGLAIAEIDGAAGGLSAVSEVGALSVAGEVKGGEPESS